MAKTVAGVVVLHDPLGQRVPVIFDSPHSGAEYPEDFGFVAPLNAVRRTEDAYVNELYREAPKNGATFLSVVFTDVTVHVVRAEPTVLDNHLENFARL